MAKVKQLSAWVEHRPGVLGELGDALAEKNVNIRAFMASSMDGRGFVRLVVDKPAAAKRVFQKHGWETAEDDVLEVTLPDTPGALGAVADRLGEAGLHVGYPDGRAPRPARQGKLYAPG